jgi:hypothetical protein
MFDVITRCRMCANPDLVSILHLGDQHLTGVFPRSREQTPTRGPLELVKCHAPESDSACGLVQLRQSYNLEEMYGNDYGYRSALNQSMVRHLRAKVAGLRSRIALQRGDVVLDIGSNDGTTLSCYPADAGLTLVGIDPTSEKFSDYYRPDILRIAEFFSAAAFHRACPGRRARIVTSIAMFYDLEAPLAFMREVAGILAQDGIWHFEQSYLPLMLSQNAYDTVCHEHREYYALRQIQWMADRAGLKIIDVETNDVNGGSFAVTVARKDSGMQANESAVDRLLQAEDADGLQNLSRYADFAQRVLAHRDQLLSLLASIRAEGKSVLGYGASTKGNVILQFCGITADTLPAIAEVNQDKVGAFTPGTLIPIIAEVEARARKPDYFLVLPWHFRKNLLEREAAFLQAGGKMIFPLPQIEIIGK